PARTVTWPRSRARRKRPDRVILSQAVSVCCPGTTQRPIVGGLDTMDKSKQITTKTANPPATTISYLHTSLCVYVQFAVHLRRRGAAPRMLPFPYAHRSGIRENRSYRGTAVRFPLSCSGSAFGPAFGRPCYCHREGSRFPHRVRPSYRPGARKI